MKKEKHPVSGLTSVQEIQRAKAALRNLWRRTARAKHIRENRITNTDHKSKFKFTVICSVCGKRMGQSEKKFYKTKNGRRRKTGVYHVDHIHDTGMPKVTDIETDLGKFFLELMHTKLRIVCIECHADITAKQMEKRHGR